MDLFQWKSEYNIGLPHIDAQHQRIVDMLNQLYTAKKTDQVHQVIEVTLDRLLNYTREHFADEEAAMDEVNYPYLSKQHREHLDMTDEVMKMRHRFMQGDDPATFELLNFMNEWLKVHICGSDRKFGQFMRDQQTTAMMTETPEKPQP